MSWIDVFAVCLSLALSAGAVIAINFVNARLRRVEKWINHHDYQQNMQGLMGAGQAQMSAAQFDALAVRQREKP